MSYEICGESEIIITPPSNGWISVKDKLPDYYLRVLCSSNFGIEKSRDILVLCKDNKFYDPDYGGYGSYGFRPIRSAYPVTHWMRLPELTE